MNLLGANAVLCASPLVSSATVWSSAFLASEKPTPKGFLQSPQRIVMMPWSPGVSSRQVFPLRTQPSYTTSPRLFGRNFYTLNFNFSSRRDLRNQSNLFKAYTRVCSRCSAKLELSQDSTSLFLFLCLGCCVAAILLKILDSLLLFGLF